MKPYNKNFRSKDRQNFDPSRDKRSNYVRPKETGITVFVEEGKLEQAIRRFKKKVDRAGIIKEIRDRQAYSKPSEKRKLAKEAARVRWHKQKKLMDRYM